MCVCYGERRKKGGGEQTQGGESRHVASPRRTERNSEYLLEWARDTRIPLSDLREACIRSARERVKEHTSPFFPECPWESPARGSGTRHADAVFAPDVFLSRYLYTHPLLEISVHRHPGLCTRQLVYPRRRDIPEMDVNRHLFLDFLHR